VDDQRARGPDRESQDGLRDVEDDARVPEQLSRDEECREEAHRDAEHEERRAP
jgi:hypothetical protein